jgi:GNAT superfamily N-acetyltransferase
MNNLYIFDKNNMIPDELFGELFALMEKSFPPNERRSRAAHRSEFEDSRFRSLCYCPSGLAGFMNYWDLGSLLFLEHFAVQPELRGRGVGSELMKQFQALNPDRCIILETEPRSFGEIAARRIEFYTRLGFFYNDFKYFQPTISENENPVELKLMSYPKQMSKSNFIKVRNTLYLDAYRLNERQIARIVNNNL